MSEQDSVVMTQQRFNEFVRNYLDHADQARDYWQRYAKAEFALLALADRLERDDPRSEIPNQIRAVFDELKKDLRSTEIRKHL